MKFQYFFLILSFLFLESCKSDDDGESITPIDEQAKYAILNYSISTNENLLHIFDFKIEYTDANGKLSSIYLQNTDWNDQITIAVNKIPDYIYLKATSNFKNNFELQETYDLKLLYKLNFTVFNSKNEIIKTSGSDEFNTIIDTKGIPQNKIDDVLNPLNFEKKLMFNE